MKNPFKNFLVYQLGIVARPGVSVIGNLMGDIASNETNEDGNYNDEVYTRGAEHSDPTGAQWVRYGLATVAEGEFMHDLDGAGLLMGVQFNQRILPAATRDEEVKKKVERLEASIGHKASKADYAAIRDEVEFELLPKSHIRRTIVYVLLTPENKAIVFNTSSKKAIDALACVQGFINNFFEIQVHAFECERLPVPWMDALARSDEDGLFMPARSLMVKGENKRTIRVKDRGVGSVEVQAVLSTEGYEVRELQIDWYDEGEVDPKMAFTFTEKMAFKNCVIDAVVMTEHGDKDAQEVGFHSFAWICARMYRDLIKQIATELGGQKLPTPSKEPSTATDEDEDEF